MNAVSYISQVFDPDAALGGVIFALFVRWWSVFLLGFEENVMVGNSVFVDRLVRAFGEAG